MITPKHFRGGIHPLPEGKELSKEEAIRDVPLLPKYNVVIQQNIGGTPKLVVKKGDAVKKGSILAEAEGFVSVPLHSPTSGTVGEIVTLPGAAGSAVSAVEILSDGRDEWCEPMEPYQDWHNASSEKLLARVKEAGLVGMGGASFPAHVKLSPPPERTIDTLIVNGAECEPFLTADERLMREFPQKVLDGSRIAAKILKISRILIGVEKNKPEAIESLTKIARGTRGMEIVPLDVCYPQGGEKQLIYALTGRTIFAGGLPMDAGCVVQNAGTMAALYEAVVEGRPLIERIVTVTGSPVKQPGNYRLRIGTSLRDALTFAKGIKSAVGKIILGGPMMGFAQSSLDVTVCKNTSGILLLGPEEIRQYEAGPCLSCGRCSDSCPMGLSVSSLSKMCECERYDLAEENFVMSCLECGICTYVCPAGRPNVQHFRHAKAEIKEMKRKKK